MTTRWVAALALLLWAAAPGPHAESAGPAAAPTSAAEPVALSSWEWANIPRVVAFGDLHGAYDRLVALLRKAELVGANLEWIGGRDHLVLLGDVVDRGPGERAALDLIRRLQDEAARQGGAVHMLLGNHEVMTMVRDLRYASATGTAAYADLEPPTDRQKARALFVALPNAAPAPPDDQFNQAYPPGWFGRLAAFGPGGTYAEWLLQQPVMIKIDGTVFVHGGISSSTAEMGGAEINRRVPADVRAFWALRDVLSHAEGMPPFPVYEDVQVAAQRVLRQNGGTDLEQAARALAKLRDEPAFAPDGPLWYRGLSLENERAEEEALATVLERLGARRIVVGHTPTKASVVTSRFDGRVVRADVALWTNPQGGGVIIDHGNLKTFDLAQAGARSVRVEPPWGEEWAAGVADLPDAQLEPYLENAQITSRRRLGGIHSSNPVLVQMRQDNLRLRALYKEVDQLAVDGVPPQRWQHEVAAYRLDRMLGLGLVPVTVMRRIDERWGSMQAWVEAAITAEKAEKYGIHVADRAAVDRQLASIGVFDALIGNPGRSPRDILLVPSDNRVQIVDQAHAFPLDDDVARFLPAGECHVDARIATALRALDEKKLRKTLVPLLNNDQIAAVLARRDGILSKCR